MNLYIEKGVQTYPNLSVVSAHENFRRAIDVFREEQPEVQIFDISIPVPRELDDIPKVFSSVFTGCSLSRDDILIAEEDKQLIMWSNAGGTAIKLTDDPYKRGTTGVIWLGYSLLLFDSPYLIEAELCSCLELLYDQVRLVSSLGLPHSLENRIFFDPNSLRAKYYGNGFGLLMLEARGENPEFSEKLHIFEEVVSPVVLRIPKWKLQSMYKNGVMNKDYQVSHKMPLENFSVQDFNNITNAMWNATFGKTVGFLSYDGKIEQHYSHDALFRRYLMLQGNNSNVTMHMITGIDEDGDDN